MSDLTKAELLEKAKELNLEGVSGLNKADLAEAVAAAEEAVPEVEAVEETPEEDSGTVYDSSEEFLASLEDEEVEEDVAVELTLHQKAQLGLVKQEDIINFPPPVGVREALAGLVPQAEEVEVTRTFAQKANLQTDGTEGVDQNLDHAYVIPDPFKTSNPDELAAAQVSDSTV